jgi:hypothetical protein
MQCEELQQCLEAFLKPGFMNGSSCKIISSCIKSQFCCVHLGDRLIMRLHAKCIISIGTSALDLHDVRVQDPKVQVWFLRLLGAINFAFR